MVREVNHSTGAVTTVAGNGTAGYSGDGGAATAAELSDPDGLALDGSGDLFIADSDNNVIREVNLDTGIITTVAGNGTAGYSGDGGPATAAELSEPDGICRSTDRATSLSPTPEQCGPRGQPQDRDHHHRRGQRHRRLQRRRRPGHRRRAERPGGVAVDGSGDLFIADTGNNVIREVNLTTGIITTVAGTGTRGYSGDGGPATAAELNDPRRRRGQTARATSSSPTPTTTWSARSTSRPVSSPPSPATATRSAATAATAVRPPPPSWTLPSDWRWTARATSSSPTT